MQITSLAKVTAPTAQEICQLAGAGGHQLAAGDGATPLEFLGQLMAQKRLDEAVKFLAFGLPPREAVWWACVCARMELGEAVAEPIVSALHAAETWVRKPTDDNRRAAMAAAQVAKFESPAAWAAVAAFWSCGSMAPPELPAVPPAPHLLGIAVAGAVTLAAVLVAPEQADEKRERYVAAAVHIANGGNGHVAPPAAGGMTRGGGGSSSSGGPASGAGGQFSAGGRPAANGADRKSVV